MQPHSLLIIGSGPAGYTAAIYAARAGLGPILLTGSLPGGQLMTTTEVENWPGESKGIFGAQLMDNMREQAERFGTEMISETVLSIKGNGPFNVQTDKQIHEASAIIVASGASVKWLGIPGEARLMGKGVSGCATCDGFFFQDKDVVLVGGGDVAMEEANFISRFAKSVTILVRRDVLRASKIMQERAQENPKISFLWNSQAKELVGEDRLEAVVVAHSETGEETRIEAQGFFVAIGHKPSTEFLQGVVDLDMQGYIIREPNTSKTSVPGIFACGDVIDPHYRQAITSAGSGCIAALDAERWLSDQ